ncbi:hypothetical protein WICMUC_005232 [Wickerhamomyces mucosus]|uniref:Uncharacterized protein n=1 Tax=Wickerhamomyces mucosus TaxID=1378264 RepID=A0A9P8P9E4_9ASCO|nr:hypothetical protein WICMUC_005232 [Wickerhamomyces mucosus]
MYATSVRAFQRSAIRMNSGSSSSSSTSPVVQWFGYFAGITGITLVGAGILYQFNKDHDIKKAFKRHNINGINNQ